eukprot:CAMPEP_0184699390 /NCGR_PEP_ID=MMETSP0313-20130426/5679_1 /TAXON_ID=2792 /ORGANISM="Porphyridium aerugineum, Strain SAG 1380-2" /LENGTH=234 /DNA_ID=CAMNT_0027158469 /DNA_START=28 /DNA_END=728 /DNA_ORIENTATION=+
MVSVKPEVSRNNTWWHQALSRLGQTSSPSMSRVIFIIVSAMFLVTFYISSASLRTYEASKLSNQIVLDLPNTPNADNAHGSSPSGIDLESDSTDHAQADATVHLKPELNQHQQQPNQGQGQEKGQEKEAERPNPVTIQPATQSGQKQLSTKSTSVSASTAGDVPASTDLQRPATPRAKQEYTMTSGQLSKHIGRANPFVAVQQQRVEEGFPDFIPKTRNIDWLEKYSAITVMLG